MPNKDDGSISDKEKDQNKQKPANPSKESDDYAKKMWHEIEKKAKSKGQREGLKEEVKENNPEKKKKRRRRKKKGPGLNLPSNAQEPVSITPKEAFKINQEEPPKPTVLPKPPEAKPPEAKPPQPKIEEIPPAPPVTPVNPFAETVLPPKQYEDRYSPEKKEDMEPADEGDEIIEEAAIKEKPEDKAFPINPFAPIAPQKPVEEKVLNEKPWSKSSEFEYDASIKTQAHEKKSLEDTGEVREVQFPEIRGVPAKVSADDQRDEKKEIKAEDQVIEVEAKERKEKTADAIPGNVETIESEKILEEPEEFKEEFWDILEHAGITKKRLGFLVIAFIVIVLGFVIFSFDWFGGADESSSDSSKVTKNESLDLTEDTESAYDIIVSYILGLEYAPIEVVPIGFYGDMSGIEAAFIFGQTRDLNQQQFVEYVALLRKLENIYEVNIYDLVNLAVDRRAALDQHLFDMKMLIDQANDALILIDQRLVAVDAEYALITTQRDAYEQEFFNSLNTLYGESASEFLDLFVANSQKAVELQAEFNSFAIVQKMFLSTLEFLQPRYADIQANKEALIKGVKVFDVPASDIDAIIPLQ